jgi:ABC-type phosphate transport system permease subunit
MNYYNRRGEPINMWEWFKLNQDGEYRRIKQDLVGTYNVSTVWLGLDHSFTGGILEIFETIIFSLERIPLGLATVVFMERYATEEEAIKGHEAAIAGLLSSEIVERGAE